LYFLSFFFNFSQGLVIQFFHLKATFAYSF
jgi:hypothetical protein